MAQQHQKRWFGYLLVIIGASFWGVGGTVSQWLFQHANVDVTWFVAVRLMISGLLLLGIAFISEGSKVFHIWRDKQSITQILIYGLLGMLAVQYTFMVTISYGNAAVATLLQYLGLIFIIFYLVIRKVTKIGVKEIVAVLLALSGTFLLLTNGDVENLQVPKLTIVWGLLSALALAFYTIYPVKLLARWSSLTVVGWAMFIGGVALSFFHPPWQVDFSTWTIETHLYFGFAVIFGTMLAFWFYIDSLRYLQPHESGLLGTLEPLTALLTSVVWLHITFGLWQLVGVVCIILMVVVVSVVKNK
ncbi:EamA family transporter [Staphylococcus intermedius]|uniref:Transporter, drug/metabolite exporter family n=1 Tax=Staphylococcus intermedius NCTC 11048 TaxID=1141106 RepID=A0A380G6H7_STAIN|nr:DMT family transporter [Staphylococcus intermedius]PCF63830.1 EamA family transporter [Staphylococcus intermedius]PCF78545.1 EamA family transporter [Staphylococcus intermedius]PCF79518.1 EamA family transporter [Staphylococcus intermedius]PCF86746.1 EamA family transporter [Staphylococcus intermedius]PCF89824.1 EamA family transporter [Staphylococcus intermedius]